MLSSAFVVLKPQTEAAGQAPHSQPPQLERTVSVIEDVGGVTEDQEGEVTYRKVSKDDEHCRVVTIRSKVRRTPSNADEEIRDTVVETDFHSPGGAAVKDRDVIRSRRKITPRGSNYYQRTTHRTRRVRDQEGSDFVEHDVCVESDNTSISEGRSWGSKTVTKVTVDRPSGGLPPALDELARLPQLEAPRTGKGAGAGAPLVRMDMSKASSGYGSVSGSEEEDKDTSPPPDLKTAGSLVGFRKRQSLQRPILAASEDSSGGSSSSDDVTPRGARSPQAFRDRTFPFLGRRRLCAPEVLAPLKDVSTVEGQAAVLECTLSAQPAPEVTWYLGDKKLDASEELFSAHFDTASGKATLTLQEAVVGHGGVYTCVCSNEFGEASTRSSLLVKQRPSSKPVFVEPLSDVTVAEDHSVTLSCAVTSAASVAWYKDGLVQRHSSDFKQTFDGRVARLEIGEVFLDDVGIYSCLARNELGEERTSCRLTVTAGNSETTVVPMFLTKLPNKTLNDGDSLLLECDVIGSPEPSIRWLRDGLDLPDSLSFNSQYDGRVARLRVERMAVEDEGLFECVAENSAGKVSMDARVHVQKRNKAPSFSSCLQDVSAELGHNVCLRCQVSGTPAPSVFWRRNGLIVADTPDFLQSLTRGLARLEIFGVKDKHGGQYECVAKNDAGDAVCSCYLTVTHPKATEPPAEAAPPPVTTRRTFKKLSEPQHSDIISAVLVSAGKKTGVQRAQSFSPQSAPAPTDSARPPGPLRAFSVQAPGAGEARPLEGEREALNGAGVSADSAGVGDTDVKAVSRYTVQWRDREGRLADGPGGGSPSPSPSSPSSTSSPASGPLTTTTTRDNASSSAAADSPRPAATTTTTTTSSPPQAAPDRDSQLPVPAKTAPPSAARGRASPSPERKLSEPPKASPQAGKSPRSMVSQLRAQFNKLEETADRAGGSGGGIRRWHSMPLKQERPTVVKRGPSQLAVEDRGSAAAAAAAAAVRGADATETATMSSYDHINDEEELHKLMNATESFEERKKIRTRLREIRDKQREEMEARRLQREKETEDLVRRKFEIAEEEKKRKMQAFNEQKPTCERDTQYHSTSQKLILDKHQLAEEEKQKKLEAYKHIAQKEHQTDDGKTSVRTTTTTTKAPDGSTTVTKKTETTTTVKQTSGFGGVQYGAPRAAPELNTRNLKEQLSRVSGPGSSGSIAIKTESWSSVDGVARKAQKTESWGAKPQGPRGAMAAFKQMDAANPAPKPNKPMVRSPSAIKQVLLDWCKAMTREYENIQVTNFSSCWNNGLAFCALIHHFYPDAFDYSQLDPKNRRYNFNLAFDTAEKLADIAPLLDVEDMVRMKNPDWKCVFTYVQSIYRHLRDHENNKTKVPAEA